MSSIAKSELTRELALVRVNAAGADQDRALDVVGQWSARLLELSGEQFTVELAGDPRRLNEFLDAIQPYGTITLSRSGELRLS